MSEFSKIITLIELLSVTVFTCYAGVLLLPISVIAAICFFLLACLPVSAIILEVFAKKQIIKAPMQDFVLNLIIIGISISQLYRVPEIAALTYSAITLAAIDLCVNILNFISPQKEYLTLKNAAIFKTAGVLAVTEWILMAILCALLAWNYWGNLWWIAPVALVVIYLCLIKKSNPGKSAPIGGILIDLIGLVFCTILYFYEPDYRIITITLILTIIIDFIRCIIRKTCTITSLEQS